MLTLTHIRVWRQRRVDTIMNKVDTLVGYFEAWTVTVTFGHGQDLSHLNNLM